MHGAGASEQPRRLSSAANTRTTAWRRAVGELGLGTDNAVVVPSRDYRMNVDALAGDARRPARCRPPGDGGGRHGRHDAHRVLRRYRRDRAHLRGARPVAAHRRSPRCVRPAVARAPIATERHSPCTFDCLGPAQDDAHAAHGQRRPRQTRARSGIRVLPAGALPVPRPRRSAELGPGTAQLRVLAPDRRIEGLGGGPTLRRLGTGRAL